MQVYKKLFIDGEWVEPTSKATIDVISPHTEEVIGRVPEARVADIDAAVKAAREAFDAGPWPSMAPGERADVMAKLSAALQERADEMAVTITNEMGSPISFSRMGQAMAATMVLDYYTGLAREYPFEEMRPGMLGPVLVRREPVGVVGAIVPWNVPQFVTMMKLGPALGKIDFYSSSSSVATRDGAVVRTEKVTTYKPPKPKPAKTAEPAPTAN